MKVKALQTKNFWISEILHFKMRKWTENELTSPTKHTPLEIKNILTSPKTQNSNIPTPSNLSGGCTLSTPLTDRNFRI